MSRAVSMLFVMSSASPAALAALARAGGPASAELAAAGRRLGRALSASPAVPPWAAWLADDVTALARSWEGLDRWVVRVGAAFAAADAGVEVGPPAVVRWRPEAAVPAAPTWVDRWSDAEASAAVLAWGARLRGRAGEAVAGADRERLRAQLRPLWERVRARWPEAAWVSEADAEVDRCAVGPPSGLASALDAIRLAGSGRARRSAGVWEALASGFLAGEADEHGYDTFGAELARTTGHVASGVAVFGDVRDAVVDVAHGDWAGAAFSAAGLVPGLGDAAKGGRAVDDLVAWRGVPGGLAAHDALPKAHIGRLHIGKSDEFLADRLARSTKRAVSTFADGAEAEAAIGAALSARDLEIRRWLRGADAKLTIEYSTESPIGRVLERNAPSPVPGAGVRAVLLRHEWEHEFRVLTAFPVP